MRRPAAASPTRSSSSSRPTIEFGPLLAVVTAAIAGVLVGFALTASAPVTGITQVSTAVAVGLPVARAVLDVAAVAAIGFSLLPLLAGGRRPASEAEVFTRSRLGVVLSALAWAVAAVVCLVLQAAEYRPIRSALSLTDLVSYVETVAAGKALLVVAGFALAQAGAALAVLRRPRSVPVELVVALGLFALLPLPVTGHAGMSDFAELGMVLLELHVIAVVAWTGGLAATVALAARHRGLLAATLPRFSRLATVCLAATAVTGVGSALSEFVEHPTQDLWPGLVTTTYGQLLLAKAVALAATAALGGYVRWRLLPAVVRHRRTALGAFAVTELTVMGLAFGIAAVLSRTPLA